MYNHCSKRVEEYCYDLEKKTVSVKSRGFWWQNKIDECINNKPYILPSSIKSSVLEHEKEAEEAFDLDGKQLYNEVSKNYKKGRAGSLFIGTLDYKMFSRENELWLLFTDEVKRTKVKYKVSIESDFQDKHEIVDFLNVKLGLTYSISIANDSLYMQEANRLISEEEKRAV